MLTNQKSVKTLTQYKRPMTQALDFWTNTEKLFVKVSKLSQYPSYMNSTQTKQLYETQPFFFITNFNMFLTISLQGTFLTLE